MEENVQKEQTLSVADLLEIIRAGLIWIVAITLVCLALGVGYAYGVQPTSYTAKLNAYFYVDSYENIDGEKYEVSEHTRYQYSALLAQECETVFKSNDVVSIVKQQVPGINVSAVKFSVREDSPFFTVSYTISVHGGDQKALKQQVVDTLNNYVMKSMDVINDNANPHWHKGKIYVNSLASVDNVSVNAETVKTIALAFIAGLVLSVVFVLLKHFLDDTVNSREQVEIITGTQIIALIDISANLVEDNKVVPAKEVK
ncbi:MAG: hypothetical protein IKL82_01550 [Clostridia bacterium]|nr:hypothetical protein [Clostridia bacterium]